MEHALSMLEEVSHDENFCALLRLSQRRALSWDDFLEHPLPAGMSPRAAWEMITSIGSCLGVHLFPDRDGSPLWYRRTYELNDLVSSIERRTRKNSSLHDSVLFCSNKSIELDLRLSEAFAVSQLSGLSFDLVQVEMSVRLDLKPKDPAERLIFNEIKIDESLSSYLDNEISFDLIEEIRARLIDGVDANKLLSSLASGKEAFLEEPAWARTRDLAQRLVNYANIDSPEDPVVLKGALIADVIHSNHLFGSLSTQIASLISRLYYLKRDLPIIAVAPTSETKRSWTLGELDDHIPHSRTHYESNLRRARRDLTVHQTISAYCLDLTLDGMEQQLVRTADADRAVDEMVAENGSFNQRQRAILTRAVRIPLAEFSIRYHQDKNKISYATARRDLMDLKEAGFLRVVQRGKTFVFMAGERIGEYSTPR